MATKKVYKKLPKLDKLIVKHSIASESDDRVWFYEELEAEILDFAKYIVKKAKNLKGDPGAVARLSRVGKSINNLKISSSFRGKSLSRTTARAGKVVIAQTILIKNIKVSNMPISAWYFSAEKDQVDTPIARVSAVKTTAAPVFANVCSNASVISIPSLR